MHSLPPHHQSEVPAAELAITLDHRYLLPDHLLPALARAVVQVGMLVVVAIDMTSIALVPCHDLDPRRREDGRDRLVTTHIHARDRDRELRFRCLGLGLDLGRGRGPCPRRRVDDGLIVIAETATPRPRGGGGVVSVIEIAGAGVPTRDAV